MKTNKLKILLMGACCFSRVLWTEAQGANAEEVAAVGYPSPRQGPLANSEEGIQPFIHAPKTLEEKSIEFDNIINEALREKYSALGYPQHLLELKYKQSEKWSCLSFLKAYTSENNTKYPPERLEQLLAKIKDVQLEFFYINEVDIGLYNQNIDQGYDQLNPNISPFLLLRRLSFDQNLIVKSRILWEKIMNFTYYLETGKELEMKRKSKKSVFFDFMEKHEKWKFLGACKAMLTNHDDKYRTPEVHKGSTLKKELISSTINPQELLNPVNFALNVIWENIISIISGEKPIQSWGLPHESPLPSEARDREHGIHEAERVADEQRVEFSREAGLANARINLKKPEEEANNARAVE